MKRESRLVPGYDCRERCTDPRHIRWGGDHGCHGDEWHYTVSGGECAFVLVVDANKASRIAARLEAPEGAYLASHYPWRMNEEEIRANSTGEPCTLIQAGRCFGDAGCLLAKEFFKVNGVPQFEQPESFWIAFKQYATERIADARKSAAEFRFHRCPTCGGSGLMTK